MNAYGSGSRNRRAYILLFALASPLFIGSATLTAAQTYTVLYSFAGGADGAYPQSPVTLDPATGNLYGVTIDGGSVCANPGCGTVFELTSTGVESVVHSFTGNDGAGPRDIFLDAKGNLFGTTFGGGAFPLDGTVFGISSTGVEKVLHSFKGGGDGQDPSSGLMQGA